MKIKYNSSLKPFNTFGLDAKCDRLVHIPSSEALRLFLSSDDGSVRILGGGSNILFSADQDGTIVKNEIKGISVIEENDHSVLLKVGGGEVWHDFVIWAIENGYGGLENLSLIPGTVGAAPIQNIGAYGVEQENVFDGLNAVDITTGNTTHFNKAQCDFGYRHSIFKEQYKGKFFITHVFYRLTKHNHIINISYGKIREELEKRNITSPTIKDISNVVIAIRKSKLPDPLELGNCGSFFKNPIVRADKFQSLSEKFPDIISYPADNGNKKVPAGWLIDQCGWKGKRIGETGCYEKQALVLVNYGNATGTEVLEHARNVQSSVLEKFGIELVPEVNIW